MRAYLIRCTNIHYIFWATFWHGFLCAILEIKPWPKDLFEFLKKKKKLSKKVGDIWANGEEERVRIYAARFGLREKHWVGGQDLHGKDLQKNNKLMIVCFQKLVVFSQN